MAPVKEPWPYVLIAGRYVVAAQTQIRSLPGGQSLDTRLTVDLTNGVTEPFGAVLTLVVGQDALIQKVTQRRTAFAASSTA